jgi:beta-lactamase class A
MSNQALALLSRADFNYGIKQAIPSSIEVAEKFGERSVIDSRSGRVFSRELHDCGLVYYPDHPYLLCVMTEGPDFNELLATIREISAAAYNFVDGTPFRTSCATQSLPEH